MSPLGVPGPGIVRSILGFCVLINYILIDGVE